MSDADYLQAIGLALNRGARLVENPTLANSLANCCAAFDRLLEAEGVDTARLEDELDNEAELDEWIARRLEREQRAAAGLSLGEVLGNLTRAWDLFQEADLATLEDVADRPRREVAAVKGIGPKSMALIDAALSVEGLNYSEAS